MNIAILYICTGSYDVLFQEFYESAKKYLFPKHNKHYFVWTTNTDKITESDDITIIKAQAEKWPISVMKKYGYFLEVEEELMKYDFAVYFNANCLFINTLEPKYLNLGDKPLFAAEHGNGCDIVSSTEHNPKSHGYISHTNYDYIQSGFFGGIPDYFIPMCKELDEWAREDVKNNTIPVWHDENLLNVYALQHEDIFKKVHGSIWSDRADKSLNYFLFQKILLRNKSDYIPQIKHSKSTNDFI